MKIRKISVIIPTFNSWKTLKDCILSIQDQSIKPLEIIVIDNASTDSTYNKVRSNFPNVKVVKLDYNSGVTGGRNKGIMEAAKDTDYFLFFDHDMIADKKMLDEMLKVAQSEENVGIVTPKIYYLEDKKRIWSAGTGINLWTGQIIFRGGVDIGQYEQVEEVQVAPASFLVKKSVIDEIKGFDDRYFVTYEDTDFCFRARREGYKTYYCPRALAYHNIPVDSKSESIRLLSRSYWIGRNRILFMKDYANNFMIFTLFLPLYLIYYLNLSIRYKRYLEWFNYLKGTVNGLFFS